MIDVILWWTGAAAWAICALVGAVWIFDQSSDWLIHQMWSRKELMTFVADRLRAKRSQSTAS